MRMSMKKTEVLEVSRGQPVSRPELTVNVQQLKQITVLRYLDKEIQARLQNTGKTWGNVIAIIYDKRIPIRLKMQVYKTMVRPVLLHGAEALAIKKEHGKKLEVAENEKHKYKTGVEGIGTEGEDTRKQIEMV